MTQTLPPAPSPTAAVPVDMISPVRWVERGWEDLRANPIPGLAHGALVTAFGWLLMWAAREKFWLLAGAFSGFLIVAPVLATGLYHVSRERAVGRQAGLADVFALWRSFDGRLVRFGLLLGLAGTGWVLTSAGLITLWSEIPINKPVDFLRHVVLVREPGLFEVWLLMGSLLAAPVFASSVVAIPMLVDKSVPVSMAVTASWRAVADHPGPLVWWAVLIGMLVGLGMITALLGLIVVIPLVAHASWHAYRDLCPEPPTSTAPAA
ncbi:DUF2189 domain-containing protein [Hydrogenophaga sp.]|uniref:DUF2189 domain-containing protein n=2 Tax=Hydrogenophaga sp. TaxID=1904254 RepID=UPI002AC9F068|nr:DUF2189 domain-containing protein [Hydrogenophaga sp.]